MAGANGSMGLTWVEREVVTKHGSGCRFVVLFMHPTVRAQTCHAIPDLPGTADARGDSCGSARPRHAALR